MGIDKSKSPATAAAELRRHAEKRLRANAATRHPSPTDERMQRFVHELQVHQVELELQNAELRLIQQELELSRNKYAELYDFAPVGYFTLDAHGVIQDANVTGARLLGMERALLLNRPFAGFVAEPADLAILSRHHEEVLQNLGGRPCEIRLKKKKGAVFYAQLQSSGVETSDGAIGRIRTAIIDVTDRKRAEEQIQRQIDELRSLNEELARFNSASVGRELRMIELKEEVNKLCIQSGKPQIYLFDLQKDQLFCPA